MSRVAIATCRRLDPTTSPELSTTNIDPDSPYLLAALADAGIDATLCVWDDDEVQWNNFDLVVVRSTWDYSSRRDEFLRWAKEIPRLLNPYDVLEYSTDKHYLEDLGQAGHRIVPSYFCDVGETPIFPSGDFVIKPCVGAGSIDAERYGPEHVGNAIDHVRRLHRAGRDVLIQPYVTSVDDVGERALVFIEGTFSHAMTKGAMLNTPADQRDMLFRFEQMSVASAESDAVDFAQRIFNDLDFGPLLYARVDVVRVDADWALMELELVEPSLFLQFHAGAADALASAIKARLR